MPLVSALKRIAQGQTPAPLLIDAPGVTRGVAGAELLLGIAATGVDAVLVLARQGKAIPLLAELRSLAAGVFVSPCDPQARRLSKRERARRRTALWDASLEQVGEYTVAEDIPVIGTPPPEAAAKAWRGASDRPSGCRG